MDALYRDTMGVAREALRAARQRRRQELDALTGLEEVAGVRAGRRAAGLVLLAFAAIIACLVLASTWASFAGTIPPRAGWASLFLVAAWPAAFVTRRIAAAQASAAFVKRIRRAYAEVSDPPAGAHGSEDAYGALAQLEASESSAHRLLRNLAEREGPSLTAWLAGVSLLAPLSLHFALLLGPAVLSTVLGRPAMLSAIFPLFDRWIEVSGLVAHALIAPSLYAFHFVRRLEDDPECLPHWQIPLLIATIGTLLFPGLVLGFPGRLEGLLPAFLVFATVGTFLPSLYERTCRALRGERTKLQVCAEAAGLAPRA